GGGVRTAQRARRPDPPGHRRLGRPLSRACSALTRPSAPKARMANLPPGSGCRAGRAAARQFHRGSGRGRSPGRRPRGPPPRWRSRDAARKTGTAGDPAGCALPNVLESAEPPPLGADTRVRLALISARGARVGDDLAEVVEAVDGRAASA